VITLTQIALTQYRIYNQRRFDFTAPVMAITGPNGSGKTALLDAAYYLCYTKSYFTAQQQSLAQWGNDGFRVEGTFERDGREEVIVCKWQAGKKEIHANGAPYERLNDHIGRYAAVMIAPDDGELLTGGSELRRRWVDSILAQTDREYLEHLLQYGRILLQRNAWLKAQALRPTSDRVELQSYDLRLAEHGAYIYEGRRRFLDEFVPLLQPFHQELTGGVEPIGASYISDIHERPLSEWLEHSLEADLRAQRTTRGIHRDDWEFRIHDQPVKPFASQGQRKSLLFALKLSQYAYLNEKLGYLPMLLLDDVFEKLDQSRIEALLRIIQGPGFGQVLLTDTHADRVRDAFGSGALLGFITV
jgi:DNA replication and repair protein RecF